MLSNTPWPQVKPSSTKVKMDDDPLLTRHNTTKTFIREGVRSSHSFITTHPPTSDTFHRNSKFDYTFSPFLCLLPEQCMQICLIDEPHFTSHHTQTNKALTEPNWVSLLALQPDLHGEFGPVVWSDFKYLDQIFKMGCSEEKNHSEIGLDHNPVSDQDQTFSMCCWKL